jgi:hypothetical protein
LPEVVDTLTCTLFSLKSAVLAARSTEETVGCFAAAPAEGGKSPATTSERAGRASRDSDIRRGEIMHKA